MSKAIYPKQLHAEEVPVETSDCLAIVRLMIDVGFIFQQFNSTTFNVILPWRNRHLAESIAHRDKTSGWSKSGLVEVIRQAFECVESHAQQAMMNRIQKVVFDNRSPWTWNRRNRREPEMTVEQLVSLAGNFGYTPLDVAKMAKLDPDRLSHGGLREVIQLLVDEGDDPLWLEDMFNRSAKTPA
jgi:hypothetical protein